MDQAGAVTAAVRAFVAEYLDTERVCVALSGGPDSLALTAASVRAGLSVRALVVDHRLQSGSDETARAAARAARDLGADAEVLTVDVGTTGGLEAAARNARYDALAAAADGRPVLIGHTLDDQAETVLLGLGRGSGSRSLAGMAPWRAPWGRPLLKLRRSVTHEACAQWGLVPFSDPHNSDPRFTRVRLRTEVLPLLEDVLNGGVAQALARTAEQLRDDAEVVDGLTEVVYRAAVGSDGALTAAVLAEQPRAVRGRVIRRWLLDVGATEPTSRVVGAVETLVSDWHGQGAVAVGGDVSVRMVVARRAGCLQVESTPR